MKDIRFKITLDEFFDLYYTNNLRLAISCKDNLANHFLCFALFERGNKVNGCLTIDDLNMDPLNIFNRNSSCLVNNAVYGSDIINLDRAKQLNIKIIDFYEVDCTKYLQKNEYFMPWGLKEIKKQMFNASEKMFKDRQENSKIQDEILIR